MSDRSHYEVVLRKVKYVTFTCHKHCAEEGPRRIGVDLLVLKSAVLPTYFEDEEGRIGIRCNGQPEVIKDDLSEEVLDFS